MASEIRVNSLTNRSGLSTVTIADTGVVIAGMLTATDATFTGNISVGGTATYEDVTNVDSVGVTAQVEQAYNLGIVTTAAARNAAALEEASE